MNKVLLVIGDASQERQFAPENQSPPQGASLDGGRFR